MTATLPSERRATRNYHRVARHRRHDRTRRPRLLVASVTALALVVGSSALAWQASTYRYERNLAHAHDVIDREGRPRARSQTWLLVGSDGRAERAGRQRTDAIMVVHLAGNGRSITVTSIPRDSWVQIPGHGKGKVNSAFVHGGPRLLVRTVERLAGLHIDHYAALDYSGFEEMTDAVGGVDVRVRKTVHDSANDKTWTKGWHHLGGAEALLFVRQRYGLPNGDLDRIERQQAFLKALLAKLRSRDTLTSPARLDRFLTAVTKASTVDDAVSFADLRALALRYRNVTTEDITFRTAPVASADRRNGQAVLLLDRSELTRAFTPDGEGQP